MKDLKIWYERVLGLFMIFVLWLPKKWNDKEYGQIT